VKVEENPWDMERVGLGRRRHQPRAFEHSPGCRGLEHALSDSSVIGTRDGESYRKGYLLRRQ